MPTIKKNSFAGGARISDGTLADCIRGIAQVQAKTAADAAVTLTDNSGGAAANGVVGAVPLCAATPLTGDTCPTKTETETAAGTVKDALTELAAAVVTVAGKVPAFTPVNSVGGAAADGTIGAVTKTFTGAAGGGGTCVAKTGLNAFLTSARALLAQIAHDTNALAVAVGTAELDVSALDATALDDGVSYGHTYAALSTATGTAATDGTLSVSSADAVAAFTALADGVKEVATKLTAICNGTAPALSVFAA